MSDIVTDSDFSVRWSRSQAHEQGHAYDDHVLESSIVSLTRCELQESYPDGSSSASCRQYDVFL